MCKISAKKALKIFNFSHKKPGFLEKIDLRLNLGIGFCITWLVLPIYEEKKSVCKNYFWINHANHLNILVNQFPKEVKDLKVRKPFLSSDILPTRKWNNVRKFLRLATLESSKMSLNKEEYLDLSKIAKVTPIWKKKQIN